MAEKPGVGTAETLRKWARQAEVDAGTRPGMTTEEPAEIKQLKQENAELRRARSDPQDGPGFLRRARPPTAALMRLIDGHNSAFRGRACLIGRPLTTSVISGMSSGSGEFLLVLVNEF